MKRIKISLFALLALSVLAQSCQDNREANLSPNQVYIVNSGEVTASVYDTGEDAIYNIGITKSGYMDVAATADVVVSAQALANYNATKSFELKPLPVDCYTLVSTKVSFADDQVTALYPIEFHNEALVALGESIKDYALALELTQSNLQVNFDKKYSIILPVVKKAEIAMTLPGEYVLTVDKNSKTLLANLPVSIPFANSWDLACTFSSLQEDFDAFNITKGGALTLLPEDSYAVTPENFVLAKGKQSGEIFVSIDRSKLSYASYCLPVRLAATSIEKIVPSKDAAVSYLMINTLVSIPRDTWTVADVSSIAENEGTNGAGTLAIDNDPEFKTFWHTRWAPPTAVPPHHITIDMGKRWFVGAVIITPRNNAQSGIVEVSDDKETWTKIGEFKMKTAKASQTFPMATPAAGQFFKVTINEASAQLFDLQAMGGPVEE